MNSIISVGIDIGTTTTSMVVSRLTFGNRSGFTAIPDISITEKHILYKSKVYLTPSIDENHLDGDKIAEIIKREYENAGIKAEDVESGAVIITGESLLKENAKEISDKLSSFAGNFVVTTAGPDLESIISGRGAGAETYSEQENCTVANFDIGGGTTNLSVFRCGELVDKTCLDIGGRLICYDKDKRLTYASPRWKSLIRKWFNMDFLVNQTKVSYETLKEVTDLMAETLVQVLERDGRKLTEQILTSGARLPESIGRVDVISFSGGVADCIYHPAKDAYKFHDLGVILARSIRESRLMTDYKWIEPRETIRATVVGAGIHLTEVSGSTILYSENLFPLKNLPVLIVSIDAEHAACRGASRLLEEERAWFSRQIGSEKMLLFLKGSGKVSYRELCNLARCLARCADQIKEENCPLIVLTYSDMAKSLGQTIKRYLRRKREILCMDRVKVHEGDYVDIGKPIMNGTTLPIVVKTLVFG